MSEKFLDQSGLVVLRNWVRSQIANAQLGGGGGGAITLLWENASPASSFDWQKIDLADEVGNYDFLAVLYGYSNTYADAQSVSLISTHWHTANETLLSRYHPTDNSHASRLIRAFLDAELWFGDGYKANAVNTAYAIPLAVYGVNFGMAASGTPADENLILLGVPDNGNPTGVFSSSNAFQASLEKNGNVVLKLGFLATWDVGWQLWTDAATNSYAFMISDPFDVTDYDEMTVYGAFLGYSDANSMLVGLMTEATGTSLIGAKPTNNCSTYFETYARPVTVSNTGIEYVEKFDLTGLSGNRRLAICVAGSGGSNYSGQGYIKRAWLTKKADWS